MRGFLPGELSNLGACEIGDPSELRAKLTFCPPIATLFTTCLVAKMSQPIGHPSRKKANDCCRAILQGGTAHALKRGKTQARWKYLKTQIPITISIMLGAPTTRFPSSILHIFSLA